MRADYEKARVRLVEERAAFLESPYAQKMRAWALEDPRNAKTWETVLGLIGV